MTRNSRTERLHLAHAICQALVQAGTPVQLRGIRLGACETCYVLSPSSGQTVQNIMRRASLIKRTVDKRGTRVRREQDDVLVFVTHDMELLLILNYLVPLCAPSLLVLNIALIQRGLQILFNAAPDVVSYVIFIVAVVVLDGVLAYWLPGIVRRARAVGDGE